MAMPEKLSGWAMVLNSLLSEMVSCTTTPVQHAAIDFFKKDSPVEKDLVKTREILSLISNYIYSKFTNAKINCTKSEGGFYCMVNLDTHREKLKLKNVTCSESL